MKVNMGNGWITIGAASAIDWTDIDGLGISAGNGSGPVDGDADGDGGNGSIKLANAGNWAYDGWTLPYADPTGNIAVINAANSAKLGKSGLATANSKLSANGLA